MSFWPQSYAAWVGVVAGTLSLVILVLGYFKAWVIFREKIDQQFADVNKALIRVVDDVIGLPRNVPVKTALDGIGQRVQAIVDDESDREKLRQVKLGEFSEMQAKMRDMERETKYLSDRVARSEQAVESCLSENREMAREITRQLTQIGKDIVELQVIAKQLRGDR